MKSYSQNRAQSAELFRMALQRMGDHEAAFNPQTFAVWYEHVAGVNPRLSQALAARLKDDPRLGDESVAALYQAHVAAIDAETAERVSQDIGRLMHDLSRSAESAGGAAGEVGGRLQGFSRVLQSSDPTAIAAQINEVLESTTQMRASVEALRHQVDVSRGEIDRLRVELDRVREQAVLCPLTGVLNRQGFDSRLKGLLDAPQGPPSPLCLVMLDLDHFKQINDGHGHLIGDRVLEATGLVLRRAIDGVGPAVAAARYGGEEFALLLPGFTTEQARELAEGVRLGVRSMRIRQRQTDRVLQTVTISAGLALWNADDDAGSFVARADAALYQSKRDGRDRVTVS